MGRVVVREAAVDLLDLGLLLPARLHDGLEAELFKSRNDSHRRDWPAVRDATFVFLREAARARRLCLRLLLRRGTVGQEAEEDLGVRTEGAIHYCSPHVVPTQKNGADPAPAFIFMPDLQDGRPARHPRDD